MVITAFYNLTLEVTLLFPYRICYKQATRFSYTQGEGITQGHECQEVYVIGSHFRNSSHRSDHGSENMAVP